MKVQLRNLFYVLGALFPILGMSASYDTLPKGINTFVFKQVVTSEIKSQYDDQEQENSLSLKEEFSSSRLENLSSVIKDYFDELKALSPAAYSAFSLGEFEADVNADANVQGFGYGHGITDRLTVYGSIPIYHIKTDIRLKQNKPSNLSAVQAALINAPTPTAISKFIKDLTLQLPQTNQELLQSLVVNYYGYEPLGKWEQDSLGDAEIGFIYRLTDFSDRGLALSSGLVLPTGEEDNPDSLQDVATGDGQVDTFIEAMAGISFLDKTYEFDIKTRYTYQFAATKELRLIEDSDVPVSQSKKSIREKLGNKIDTSISATYNPTYWLNFNTAYLYNNIQKTSYAEIEDASTRTAMEEGTSSSAHWIKIGVGFSTVEAYKRKKFEMPFDISLSAQKLIKAQNTASYERFDLDIKLYF